MSIAKIIPYILLFFAVIGNSATAQISSKGIEAFSNSTGITNPFELRDPFKRNLPKRSRLKKIGDSKYFNGSMFTNVDTVEGIPIEQIRVVGVLLGPNRRAIVKIVSNDAPAQIEEDPNAPVLNPSASNTRKKKNEKTYVLKEGMKLGVDGAEVKAILPGGIVLVEKIRNVYDQDEYLETIIPVSE